MKILYLADGNSIHTQKWVNGLLSKGYEIFLFSLNAFKINDYEVSEKFSHKTIDLNVKKSKLGGLNKIRYFRAIPLIKSTIREFGPDIVHAHFASSYGLLGAMSGALPLITSVWGYDIFNFPTKSFLHRAMMKYVLRHSHMILSTSEVMAKETSKYTEKDIIVTPFGIDITKFKPVESGQDRKIPPFDQNDIVIGTVKLLEKKYGIDLMLESFARLKKTYIDLPLKCGIVGYGSEESSLKELASKLGIEKEVFFLGKVNNEQVPKYLNSFDIYVALSIEDSESFGVAIIEASACGIPVIVSDAGGLPEVVENNKTGIVVKRCDVDQTVSAMEKLILNRDLRKQFGQEGLKRVKNKYDWNLCLELMQKIYHKINNE